MEFMRERLEALGRRWPGFGRALEVQTRFSEVHGGYLASAITLAAFLSIFPLLLVAVGVVGYLSFKSATDLPGEIIGRFGLTGEAATAVTKAITTAEKSRRGAIGLGTIGLLWSGLGVVAALQYAFDQAWQVSGRGLRDKLTGLLWLGGATILLVVSFGATAILNLVPWLAPVSILFGIAVNVVLWLWTMRTLTNVRIPWRDHIRGAIAGAIGFEILKLAGTIYVPRVVAASSGLYGSIGIVFALLAWLFFFGRLTVYAALVNVTRWERRHGTVTAEIELPRHPDTVTLTTTRAGAASPA